MINLQVDEGYAFDYLSILEVKRNLYPSESKLITYRECADFLRDQMGYKLFKEATDFARQQGFKYITMCRVMKHPHSHGVMKFYEKMGFVKDVETFIAKL
jgi:GNAT superfamily N-acetyltransferase